MKKIKYFPLTLFFLASAHAAETQPAQLDIFPSIGVGYNQLNFKRPGGTVNANYKTLNIGLTVTRGELFVKFSGEWFGKVNLRESPTSYTSIEREDQTVTVGMAVTQRASIFAGYTASETKDDFTGDFHNDQGYFLGAGYSFPLRNSTLGLNIAYADLDGRIDNDGGVGTTEIGKTRGFSYGLSLTGPYRQNMAYNLGIRFRSYDFNSAGVITDKDILSLSAGITF